MGGIFETEKCGACCNWLIGLFGDVVGHDQTSCVLQVSGQGGVVYLCTACCLGTLQPIRTLTTTHHTHSQGFAYVKFETDAGVAAAIAKHGAAVKGRTLDISGSCPFN